VAGNTAIGCLGFGNMVVGWWYHGGRFNRICHVLVLMAAICRVDVRLRRNGLDVAVSNRVFHILDRTPQIELPTALDN
jgi:hypothetical protein